MRVLLAIARNDYGRVGAGDSYEYTAWFEPLKRLGHEVEIFDTFGPEWAGDQSKVGSGLLTMAAAFRPDLVLMLLMEDEVPMAAVDELCRSCAVVNWFADDAWRYFSFSRHIAHHFTLVVTTSQRALDAYHRLPGVRAVLRPWGYNATVFRAVDVEPAFDLGFVGQRYGRRGRIIERLMAEGFSVEARGRGWAAGRAEVEDLATLFGSARINLNFLESSAGPFQRLGLRVRGSTRADRLITRLIAPPRQMKARPFEVAACGGFVLTNHLPELDRYFEPNREVGLFRDERELSDRVRHFLSHDSEREAIAAAGHRRSADYEWAILLADLITMVH